MVKLIYNLVESQKAISRFGNLEISKGKFDMPSISPTIRTKFDVTALKENMQNGMHSSVLSPHASCKNSIMSGIKDILGLSFDEGSDEKTKIKPKFLILPDPEYEALSFNCIAREKFAKIGGMDVNIRDILNTKLSGKNVEQVWRQITKDFGYTGLKDWAYFVLDGVESDIFLAQTPIIFANKNSVEKAFNHGYNILDEALNESKYSLYGIHFLLHYKLFEENNGDSNKALQRIYTELDTWSNSNRDRYSGIIFSYKLYDNNKTLQDHISGSLRRHKLSDFTMQVSDRIRRSDGAVLSHNFGNWTIGMLDSGADICTFRMSGETKIDTPIVLNKKARATIRKKYGYRSSEVIKRKVPTLFNYDTLCDTDIDTLKEIWEKEKAYPIPSCIPSAEPYWEWDDYYKKLIYCIKTRCGSLIELGEEYRDAGIDIKGIPLGEAIRGRIRSSQILQELSDLCPSLSNNK